MIPIRLHSATIRALKGNWWGVTRPTCDVRYDSALRIYPTRDLPHTHEMARGSKLQHPHQRERQRVKKVFTQLPSHTIPLMGLSLQRRRALIPIIVFFLLLCAVVLGLIP